MAIFAAHRFFFVPRGSLTKALDLSTLSKLVVSNGGEISGPENATVPVVGKCAPNKEPKKPFCLLKVLRP